MSRRNFKDPAADKKGTSGTQVRILTNYFKVTKLPKFEGLHQYVCSFDPDIQSRKLKGFILSQITDDIGTVKVFDGMTLFLPIKTAEPVIERVVALRDGTQIKVKVVFTNEVPVNSPQIVQLMGILFRRYFIYFIYFFGNTNYFYFFLLSLITKLSYFTIFEILHFFQV